MAKIRTSNAPNRLGPYTPNAPIMGPLPVIPGIVNTGERMPEASLENNPQNAPPISQPQTYDELAPWPQIDRSPIIIGQKINLTYLASVMRLCLIGYRQQYVDMLDELLEKDPHLYSVCSKRVLAVANAKIAFTPAKVKTEAEKKLAQEVCDFVEEQFRAIPKLKQAIQALAWSVYYSIGALEIHWEKKGAEWRVSRLSMVHSRRLSYPDTGAWDLYVWDQGNVLNPMIQSWGQAPTNGVYGLRIADYPAKFVVHTADVRGDYPTRDGLGRQVATWVILKLIGSRGGAAYLERFSKPWPEVTYATSDDIKKPRAAGRKDIESAEAAASQLGIGTLSSWVHPDTLKLDLKTPDGGSNSKLTFIDWMNFCNSEESKAVLGGTLSTDPGEKGARSLGDNQEKGETTNKQYDADNVATTLDRDLVYHIVRLNYGEDAISLAPTVKIHVEGDPSPDQIIDRAVKFAGVSTAVSADQVAEQAGIPLVDPNDPTERRLVPLKMVDPVLTDPEFSARVETVPKPEPEEVEPPMPGVEPVTTEEKPAEPPVQ